MTRCSCPLKTDEAVSLLCSLEETGEDPPEVEKLWIVEAEGRLKEIQSGSAKTIPADEVMNRLKS